MKKFEFVLYINGNIICQRYFSVKGYNREVRYSMDLKWCIDEVVGIIKEDLKEKSKDYLYRQFNTHVKQTKEEIDANRKDIYEKEDFFDFEIKVDDRVMAKSRFSGNLYPQRVRYSVDVRKLIPGIISNIQEAFSQEYFTVEYSGIEL
jgi:hypothetical protein